MIDEGHRLRGACEIAEDCLDGIAVGGGCNTSGLSIEQKIAAAYDLHRRWGDLIEHHPPIPQMLEALRERIQASQLAMIAAGVSEQCRICEQEEGGSCCGTGIENRYTAELLWINLLIGCEVPSRRASPGSCLFLGTHGCRLTARDTLCVNYLCPQLQNRLPTEALIRLQQTIGEEINLLFRLHERIRRLVG
jgi:hypothetical protein